MLATKLFPPGRREVLVARPRLAEQLDMSLADPHHLTLVSAPAGFGKTTLLTAWLESLGHRHHGLVTAWVSLDSGDNDLTRLLTHVAAALGGPGLDLDPSWSQQPSGNGIAAVTALVNELATAREAAPERRWVLVLDDYHVIRATAVHEAVSFLLDHLPRQVHLVIATRSDPPLPLARLRTRGQLVEVRAVDLRFSTAEARDFLNRVMGLDLTERDVEALESRTEGWVAGLQLAALSLRNATTRAETSQFIDAFTGSNRFVIDYLLDEVLARLSETEHEFLLRTSVLERLTGSLCDALTETPGGAGTLEQLERDNVFVVALDTERTWFRYHHLFADVLRARLIAAHPDAVPQLHLRASQWFADHDYAPDAVNHALAGGDGRRAAYLVEQALPQTRRARHDTTLLNWVAALPAEAVRASPVLNILSGWSAMMSGDLAAMEASLDEADAALSRGARDPAVAAGWAPTEDLRTAPATVHVYRAALAQARGDVATVVEHAEHALALAQPEDHFVRGAAGGFLGMAAWAAGDMDRALSTFTQAAQDLRVAGNHVDALDTSIVVGSMWLTAGRPTRARRTYEEALTAAMANGAPYPRATPDLHVALAELDIERHDLDAAQEHLDTARLLGERSSITENRYRWYAVTAQLHGARGNHRAAVGLLQEAQDRYRPGAYPDIRPIPAMRARVHIAAGDLRDAEQWAREQHVSLDEDASFLREFDQLTLVRLLLAQGPPTTELARVLGTLDRLQAAAQGARAGTTLEVGMLRALTLSEMSQEDAAVAELDRALVASPEADQYLRLFLDEGVPMRALLQAAATAGDRHPAAADLAHRAELAAMARPAATATHAGEPASAAGLVDPLSERELEVLRLLDSELTGPEISSHLYVSLNTLRTHTKRIFTKLGVRNRAAAVRRGRELGLL